MPWNPAAFSPPEAGPGVMPTLAGLNIGEGARAGRGNGPAHTAGCGGGPVPTSAARANGGTGAGGAGEPAPAVGPCRRRTRTGDPAGGAEPARSRTATAPARSALTVAPAGGGGGEPGGGAARGLRPGVVVMKPVGRASGTGRRSDSARQPDHQPPHHPAPPDTAGLTPPAHHHQHHPTPPDSPQPRTTTGTTRTTDTAGLTPPDTPPPAPRTDTAGLTPRRHGTTRTTRHRWTHPGQRTPSAANRAALIVEHSLHGRLKPICVA